MSTEKQEFEELSKRQENEMDDLHGRMYVKWKELNEKREELIEEFGSMNAVPPQIKKLYKDEEQRHDEKWGEKGFMVNNMLHKHGLEREAHQNKHLSSYDAIVKQQGKEHKDFQAKAFAHSQEIDKMQEAITKQYGGWDKVPEYQKQMHKQRVKEHQKQWGPDGTEKQAMRDRHKEQIKTEMKRGIEERKKQWDKHIDKSRDIDL